MSHSHRPALNRSELLALVRSTEGRLQAILKSWDGHPVNARRRIALITAALTRALQRETTIRG